jgi:hypothetical protein
MKFRFEQYNPYLEYRKIDVGDYVAEREVIVLELYKILKIASQLA